MHHFYGTVHGDGQAVSRCGSKKSGLLTTAASVSGAIHVRLWYDETNNKTCFVVRQIPWLGQGKYKELADGNFD